MVIVKLTGGLGNQMFQYAAAKRIAIQNDALLKIDLDWFQQKGEWTPRKYELGVFDLPAECASEIETTCLKTCRQNLLIRHLPVFLKSRVFNTNHSHIIEKSFAFDPEILSVTGDVYLDGYWQSHKYFQDVDGAIRRDFSFGAEMDRANNKAAEEIQSCKAVSLHIRRGDYVTLASASSYHGLCSLRYYEKAASIIKERVDNPSYFVFSDDIGWARDNLKVCGPTFFVDHNGRLPHLDMYLMSLCRHHIIANSSFSWWGAWLGENPDKVVVGPLQWFSNAKIDTSDLMPREWIRI